MTETDIRNLYVITRRIGNCVDQIRWNLKGAIERTRRCADIPDDASSFRLDRDDGGMLCLECVNQLRILCGITKSDEFRRIVDSCDWPIIRAIGGNGNEISLAEGILRTADLLESGMHHVLTWDSHRFTEAFIDLKEIVERSADMCYLMDQLTSEEGRLLVWAGSETPVVTLGEHPQIIISGQPAIALKFEQAEYLKDLIEHGDWLSSSEFRPGSRPDRIRKGLPKSISDHIVIDPKKGSRWI